MSNDGRLKKSQTELTAGVLIEKKEQKHTKGETERFLIRQNKTECANFRGNPYLQSHKQYKKYKNKQITELLPVGCFQKDVCETDVPVSHA